ncbi:MAG: MFS transporter [Anaerolineales bacterium]
MSETTAAPHQPAGYAELLRANRNFRFLWYGQIVSLLGDWFNLIASASLVASLTESGFAVGGLFMARMLAPFLISPLAGVVTDRYNRKHLLIATDLARALTVLGFLLVRQPQHIWLLYTLTFVQLAISGTFFPARNAILPDIVSRRELGAANTISSATWSTMLALGAALGGVVAGGWGIYPAFLIDSASFLLSALMIAQIKYMPPQRSSSQDMSVRAALGQYLDGLRYLRKHLNVLVISLHKAVYHFVSSGAFQVIQVALAEQVFAIGEGGGISLGILYAVSGVGTGLGPILVRRFTGDRDQALRRALTVGYLASALGLILISTLRSFPIVLLGNLLRAFGGGLIWVFSTQLLLQLLPDHVRGRVFSTEFALFTLATAASIALGGWGLDEPAVGIPNVVLWMAISTLVAAVMWTIWMATHKPAPDTTVDEHPG